jgi:hypothetical protein
MARNPDPAAPDQRPSPASHSLWTQSRQALPANRL